ncbi:MAG TPA: MarR family transcriptional regulator [Rhodanobacteraceae bacterium]
MPRSGDKPSAAPAPRIGAMVGQLRAELVRVTRQVLAGHGIRLNYSLVEVLWRLGERGPMCAAELTRAFPYDSGGMTRLIDQLQTRALVERRPHPTDRRVQDVVLTVEGKKLSRKLIALREQVVSAAVGDLAAPEQTRLAGYLQRMLAALRNSSAG